MLLPNNFNPKLSIYYIGSIILATLKNTSEISLVDLFQKVKNKEEVSFSSFILGLDWLYLIDATKINDKGNVEKCI